MLDNLDGKLDQVTGAVKEGLGKLTGDKGLEVEGATEGFIGKAKEVVEDVKDGIEGFVDGVKNALGDKE